MAAVREYVLSLSGGLDSTVLLASLLDMYGPEAVTPVFFRYGSKHNEWEEAAAVAVAAHYNREPVFFDLRPVFGRLSSALLAHDGRAIPRGAYAEDNMALTVVPGRNLIFASVLAALAESRAIGRIALATHAGDHPLYPDCRPAFNEGLAAVVAQSSGGGVQVEIPFSAMTKVDIVALGLALDAPLHLTRSCYKGGAAACGACGACTERLAAFAANKRGDPVAYSS